MTQLTLLFVSGFYELLKYSNNYISNSFQTPTSLSHVMPHTIIPTTFQNILEKGESQENIAHYNLLPGLRKFASSTEFREVYVSSLGIKSDECQA